jgi:alpha-tubulin suppressor-like RCC1 family protein
LRHRTFRVSETSALFLSLAMSVACSDAMDPRENSPPTLTLIHPASPESSVFTSTTVELVAQASDLEDGDLSAQIEWSSTLDGVLGTGATIQTALTEGFHTVVAEVRDSRGAEASASRDFTSVAFTWTAVAAGATHTCGISMQGLAYCWGSSASGVLGNLSVPDPAVPTAVAGGHSYEAIAGGYAHTCAIRFMSGAVCWGGINRDYGALGNGDLAGSSTPVGVIGGEQLVQISAGEDYTCALSVSGAPLCWGTNWYGNLGTGMASGDLSESAVPLAVDRQESFSSIRAGPRHACGVTVDHAAYCWGDGWVGELGDGSVEGASPTPVLVAGGIAWSTVVPTGYMTVALDTLGRAYFWGSRVNMNGQSNQGPSDSQLTPDTIPTMEEFVDLVAGENYACGLRAGGAVLCWGAGYSQVTSPRGTHPSPVPAGDSRTYVAITGGAGHVCGVTTDAALYCWGSGTAGQLGHGFFSSSGTIPVRVRDPDPQ